MLLTLNAPMAYLPLRALANSSRVCVSGIGQWRIRWHKSLTWRKDEKRRNRGGKREIKTHPSELRAVKIYSRTERCAARAKQTSAQSSSSSDNFRYNVARLTSNSSAAFSLSPPV